MIYGRTPRKQLCAFSPCNWCFYEFCNIRRLQTRIAILTVQTTFPRTICYGRRKPIVAFQPWKRTSAQPIATESYKHRYAFRLCKLRLGPTVAHGAWKSNTAPYRHRYPCTCMCECVYACVHSPFLSILIAIDQRKTAFYHFLTDIATKCSSSVRHRSFFFNCRDDAKIVQT